MTLKQYLLLMSLGTGLCWLSWVFVVISIDPTSSGILGFIFFYLSLFLAATGTISVIGFAVKHLLIKNEDAVFRHVKRTFRQSIIIALLVVFSLLLSSSRVLAWWNFILLVLVALFVEGVLFTNRKHGNVDYVR